MRPGFFRVGHGIDIALETFQQPESREELYSEIEGLVWSTARELPRMQKEVFLQTYARGKKRADVARDLGIAPKTYDRHLQLATAYVRNQITTAHDLALSEELRELLVNLDRGHTKRTTARRAKREERSKRTAD